jgi:hypothetical protein
MSAADEAKSNVEENELQDFVSSTLKAIVNGIADAQSNARGKSAHGTMEYAFNPPREVLFDIAVNARRTKSKGGGFKIQIATIGANVGIDGATESSTVSRIQFTIPTMFKSLEKKPQRKPRTGD